jgi:endoglucanase
MTWSSAQPNYTSLCNPPGGAKNLPAGLPHTNPMDYLRQAAQFASNYITNIYDAGYTDTLNLYDVSGLAHFELYRALEMAGDPSGLAVSQVEHSQTIPAAGG